MLFHVPQNKVQVPQIGIQSYLHSKPIFPVVVRDGSQGTMICLPLYGEPWYPTLNLWLSLRTWCGVTLPVLGLSLKSWQLSRLGSSHNIKKADQSEGRRNRGREAFQQSLLRYQVCKQSHLGCCSPSCHLTVTTWETSRTICWVQPTHRIISENNCLERWHPL